MCNTEERNLLEKTSSIFTEGYIKSHRNRPHEIRGIPPTPYPPSLDVFYVVIDRWFKDDLAG